ncbi:MAG TPA: hypothetical protein PKY59_24795, partial [Pyrinomonadaceae bacterium]|nr:hypothetical protein [Pyrinomonadaceae bacterium]
MRFATIFFLISAFAVSALAGNPFGELEKMARAKVSAKPRVGLADVKDIKNADALESANVPNYIKA